MSQENIRVLTNSPQDGGKFDRHTFRDVSVSVPDPLDGACQACISVSVPGSIDIVVLLTAHHDGTMTCLGPVAGGLRETSAFAGVERLRDGPELRKNVIRVLAHPLLRAERIGEDGSRWQQVVPLEALRVQTNLTRCLGPLSGWAEQLQEPICSGFNVVHLTPPQRLGRSGSAYSVLDQLCLADSMLDEAEAAEVDAAAREARFVETIGALEGRHGTLFMADLVLNHTAADSPFLAEHPDAGFSAANSPWLRPAAALDAVMLRVSGQAVEAAGDCLAMDSAGAVDAVASRLAPGGPALAEARLWEFYVCSAASNLAALCCWAAGAEWLQANDIGTAPSGRGGAAAAAAASPRSGGVEPASPERDALGLASADEVEVPRGAWRGGAGAERVTSLGSGDPWTADASRAAAQAVVAAAGSVCVRAAVARIAEEESRAAAAALRAVQPSTPVHHDAGATEMQPLGCPGLWNAGTGGRFPVRLTPPALARALQESGLVTAADLAAVGAVVRAAGGAEAVDEAAQEACAVVVAGVHRLADAVNVELYRRYDEDVASAKNSIRGAARHSWLEQRGGEASMQREAGDGELEAPLAWSYFARAGKHVFACNGFVWGGDPRIDFTLPGDAAQAYASMAFAMADGVEAALEACGAADSPKGATGSIGAAAAPPQPDGAPAARFAPPPRSRPAAAGGPATAWTALPSAVPVPLVLASTPYMRRDIVIWGDCVKLRYGLRAADSPYIWDRMERYSRATARLFHALRLDNAHGTPPWVARAMLDAARQERPQLYVNAELFTNSAADDCLYASMLGINSLVRESVNADSAAAMAAQIHHTAAGGTPVASLRQADTVAALPGRVQLSRSQECLPSPIPQLLFDQTHDNAALAVGRSPRDVLATAALISAAACPSGSVRGFDRLVVRNPSVVTDYRLYQQPGEPPMAESLAPGLSVDKRRGICAARAALSAVADRLAVADFREVHVHHEPVAAGGDIVVVTRAHPSQPVAMVFVVRCDFGCGVAEASAPAGSLPPVHVEGVVSGVEMAARLTVAREAVAAALAAAEDTPKGRQAAEEALVQYYEAEARGAGDEAVAAARARAFVVGAEAELELFVAEAGESGAATAGGLPLGMGSYAEAATGSTVSLDARGFVPGSVLVLRVSTPRNPQVPVTRPPPTSLAAAEFGPSLRELERCLGLGGGITAAYRAVREASGEAEEDSAAAAAAAAGGRRLRPIGGEGGIPSLSDLSVLMYRADAEERDDTGGRGGAYGLPGEGPLAWAGLAGVEAALRAARRWNSLGAAVCRNIREGDWLMDFSVARLRRRAALRGVADWLGAHFAIIKTMPPGLKPQGVDRVVSAACAAATAAALEHMRQGGSPLLRRLVRLRAEAAGRPDSADDSDGDAVAAATPSAAAAEGGQALTRRGSNTALAVSLHDGGSSFGSVSAAAAQLLKASGNAEDLDDVLGLLPVDSPVSPEPSPSGMADGIAEAGVTVFAPPSSGVGLVAALALTSVQLFSQTPSAPLVRDALVPLASPRDDDELREGGAHCRGSLCAGVDHFCTGYMRNWGRDTMISLRGLLLLTGRFAEARRALLAYAAVVRHGMVPNLMDGGSNPRYNARDATWWWLQAVADFCRLAPAHMGGDGGEERPRSGSGGEGDPAVPVAAEGSEGGRGHLLEEEVQLRFPSEDAEDYDPPATGKCLLPGVRRSLGAIVADVVQRHADGIAFREWRAGRGIDAHMKAEGFDVRVRRMAETGLLQGGNAHNCGTWMDKMGESTAHGTDGLPATPRDGAPVEMTGLQYSVLEWGAGAAARGLLPELGRGVTWRSWAETVRASFEQQYWVPLLDEPAALRADWACEAADCAVDASVAGSRGVYKDTVGSLAGWSDYQLRPNFLVAMAVAPALFSPGRAAVALAAAERQLLGCARGQMGVRTLDPSDWAYRGDYTNQESSDRATAAGWNYHQGPEWLWPLGYYLRARMHFPPRPRLARSLLHPHHGPAAAGASEADDDGDDGDDTPWDRPAKLQWVLSQLGEQRRWLEERPEAGLPELTNSNGSPCAASCRVQAWSSATLLDALWDAVE